MEYLFLGLAIALVIGFEFVNGFHDTANAVATVIYTNSLKPIYAVVWSGICNLLGVITSSGAVAFSIVALLPVELLISNDSSQSLIMVLALFISAIIWNLGTWYLGLPVSSTHTLIGSILGIGLANSVLSKNNWWDGINWMKMQEVMISLLISPLIGFCAAALLFVVAKVLIKQENLYTAPTEDAPPPFGIRAMLILTCSGVSFAHGSNDGQKGMGLMMLVLVILLPSIFSLNMHTSPQAIAQLVATSQAAIPVLESQILGNSIDNQFFANSQSELTNFLNPQGQLEENIWRSLASESQLIGKSLSTSSNFMDISESDRYQIRTDIYLVANTITKLENQQKLADIDDKALLIDYRNQLNKTIRFLPYWVKITIALALGSGTMIGWKRVVVTVGEKIGQDPLNYAQGAIAEIVTMSTIVTADYLGLPVSTTHILSSGIAGSMVANRSGVQIETLKNLLIAWLLTLPVCILLGFITYSIGILLV
jgi:inorganic phosphate transporter, PiT family